MRVFVTFSLAVVIALTLSCSKEDSVPDCTGCGGDSEIIEGDYDPQPYELDLPAHMAKPFIPAENSLTIAGVELGRQLFYDPILSSDSTQSCASCHQPQLSFTDGRAVSIGVLGIEGRRSAMALVNLAYNPNGFFWDGRAATLEEQALAPVEDHTELNEDWGNAVAKLRRSDRYPALFRQAFGIGRRSEISKELAVKAIAQFERTLISSDSRYDRVVWGNEGWFTDAELRGKDLFFVEPSNPVANHPGCSHCHFNPLFTDNAYRNNGLDSVGRLEDFADPGRGAVSNNRFELGAFRVPTLRNVELTAPYMHDGRFQTLEEVLDNYSRGGHGVENEDLNILPFTLSERNKEDLLAFLQTLTDTSFVRNPAFQNPFN